MQNSRFHFQKTLDQIMHLQLENQTGSLLLCDQTSKNCCLSQEH